MFAWKKDRAAITERDPVFEARYLGSVETFAANGKGCAIIPVRKLWENSQSERHLKKVNVAISAAGVVLTDTKKDEGKKFSIENITFCNADKSVNERVFCWIWKAAGVSRLECHAVLCRSRETAQAMALVLSRAFQVAYKDWRVNRGRQIRQNKNSLLQEKEREGEEDSVSRGSDGCQVLTEGEMADHKAGNGTGTCQTSVEQTHKNMDLLDVRRGSTASSTSGFASSLILDPDEEELIQANVRVQAIVSGEGGMTD